MSKNQAGKAAEAFHKPERAYLGDFLTLTKMHMVIAPVKKTEWQQPSLIRALLPWSYSRLWHPKLYSGLSIWL